MGTESLPPPNLKEEKPQNPASEFLKPMEGDGHDSNGEATKAIPGKSVFVNSEPMREEQVQNAVKFLSHPKVKGSPVIYRRSFLEKKGLTKEEIDEAFRRVPDPPSNNTSVQETTSSQDGQLKPSTSLQSQIPSETSQPAAPLTSAVSTAPTLYQSRFHWTHALFAVGLFAASGAGTAVLVKNVVLPRLKTWIRKVVMEENESEKRDNQRLSLAEEAAAAAKAAAAAAADVAKASQEMLHSKNEEKKYFEAVMSLLDVQVEEMKSMGNALRKLEGTREVTFSSDKQTDIRVQSVSGNGPSNGNSKVSSVGQTDHWTSAVTKPAKVNGTSDVVLGSARPSSAPVSVEPAMAPHSKSYMEIMAMVQRGEKPPGIKEINDMPPNPNQQPSNPRLAPRIKPWEVGQVQHSSNRDGSSSERQDNGGSYSQWNGNSLSSTSDNVLEPWWRQKAVKITEIEPEMDEPRMVPGHRGWVPPQLPAVVMPEAAVAIRQPKPVVQKEQSDGGQSSDGPLMSQHVDENNKLQGIIARESDSADVVESYDGPSDLNSSRRVEEQEYGVEGN